MIETSRAILGPNAEIEVLEQLMVSLQTRLAAWNVRKNLFPSKGESFRLGQKRDLSFLIRHLLVYDEVMGSVAPLSVAGVEREVLFLQRTLKKYKAAAPQGYENLIEVGDAIEIHDIHGIQIYRNLETFSFCSFSLSEMLCYTWEELYQRPRQVVSRLAEEIQSFLSDPSRIRVFNDLKHIITENCDDPLTLMLDFRAMIPLTSDSGEFWGTMTIKKAKIIAEGQGVNKFGFL